ncbi:MULTISPECIES: FAD-binding oxidoreductase [Sphingomonas]|uniref:FAD-binding oxidoreductase n=1 Tax=Sphingomonas molluscorum TaxID=418184 RepID=A0ABU8Q963_9SPHN|nr:FAD-binding oxidoreductase [Sphingomonas sp. JUb134]MBM7404464.1 FAD/FMN-containing dehydrogenase [Sphingomonas sp. JUb134]MBM7407644.1 FAD/FMN-containing dehydrogenase [Sphingomonas sp. JUb134]
MTAQTRLIHAIREALGECSLTTDADQIAPFLTDWRGRFHGAAAAMLLPTSTAEVATMVRLAVEHRVPLVAQGGNTSMVGGATPPADGSALLLSTRRLDRIRRLDAGAALAVAEAGVILQNLHEAAAEAGCRFPLTLGSRGTATIGGLISTNAGGTQVLRWGTMRRLVAGVEAVLPDGSIHDGLTPLPKDNRGYDIDQLLVGAEGTLGIITAATLRLAPAILGRAVAWVGIADPEAGLALLRRMRGATDAIESFEIIPGDTLERAVQYLPDARSPLSGTHPWHLLIEAVAATPEAEAPDALLARLLGDALDAGLVADAVIATSEAQAEAFWRLRDSLSAAERAAGPAVQHDISVPVNRMPRFMVEAAAAAEARFPGTHATAFGHLGDGNVHFHVRAPAGVDPARWIAEEAPGITTFVHDLVVAAGGSISAEHGIGQMKRDELARLGSPARLAALRGIKQGLDPMNLFNPGKLVTLAPVDGAK